jgi:hypothetical protein
VPAALLGATRCRRCGHEQSGDPACERCGLVWCPAAPGSVTQDQDGPLTGVVRASVARRYLAHLIDLVGALLVVGVGIALATGILPVRVPWWLVVIVAAAVLGTQIVLLAVRGRTLGRLLLHQRTVDDLTGTPVRPGRLARRLGQGGWHRQLVTADLGRGRDPLGVRLSAAPTAVPAEASQATAGGPATTPPTTSQGTQGARHRTSVGIVLDTGERYEIEHALLLGRSPVDPAGAGDRALLAWPDMTRRLAKTHALLEWSGSVLWVTDLSTASGTTVVMPGGERQLLAPGVRTAATVGCTVECGGRSMKVVPGG